MIWSWFSWSIMDVVVVVVAAFLTALIVYWKYYKKTQHSNTIQMNNLPNNDNFPEYDGKDGREVLSEFTAAHPNFRLEIVPPNALKDQEPDPQQQLPDPKRARMYVTQAGKVIRITIG